MFNKKTNNFYRKTCVNAEDVTHLILGYFPDIILHPDYPYILKIFIISAPITIRQAGTIDDKPGLESPLCYDADISSEQTGSRFSIHKNEKSSNLTFDLKV
jgi:hypothetical protein